MKPFFKSKKFWSTIIAFLIPIINNIFNVGLSVEETSIAVAPFLVYVSGLAFKEKNDKL